VLRYFTGYVAMPMLEKYTGRQISPKLKELQRFSQLTDDQQKDQQVKRLFQFLQYCEQKVPFYQKLFAQVGFQANEVLTDPRAIQKIPILTKQIVRENTDLLRSPRAQHVRKTGGSTGASVFFYYDQEGLDWTSAINLIALEMAGRKPHHNDCHISADLELLNLVPKNAKDRLIDWVKMRSQNRSRLMVSRFDFENLDRGYQQLLRERPYMLQGHPSSAFALANYILDRKKSFQGPLVNIFEPSGEMLTQKIVNRIEAAFKCKVVNRYGNAEFGVVAHSRPEAPWNQLEIFRRAFYIEPVQSGPLIVTAFTNLGFPLVRYDTGDIGTVDHQGQFLSDIQGRVHDLVTINGREWPTHFIMDTLDHKVREVFQFQILKRRRGLPTLRIVPEEAADLSRIEKSLREIWPEGLSIEFIEAKDLVFQGWRQKFRHVIESEE